MDKNEIGEEVWKGSGQEKGKRADHGVADEHESLYAQWLDDAVDIGNIIGKMKIAGSDDPAADAVTAAVGGDERERLFRRPLEGGNETLAREIVGGAAEKRIAKQIKPDGKQPLELARTKSWDYSVMNLDAMVRLAMLGKRLDIDLWNYAAPSGRGIRAALDYLLPFATGEKEWETKQIEDFNPALLYPAVRRAAVAFPDGPYAEAMKKFSADNEAVGMDHLMFPEVVR